MRRCLKRWTRRGTAFEWMLGRCWRPFDHDARVECCDQHRRHDHFRDDHLNPRHPPLRRTIERNASVELDEAMEASGQSECVTAKHDPRTLATTQAIQCLTIWEGGIDRGRAVPSNTWLSAIVGVAAARCHLGR